MTDAESEAEVFTAGPDDREDALINKRTAIVTRDAPKSGNFDLLGYLNSDAVKNPEVKTLNVLGNSARVLEEEAQGRNQETSTNMCIHITSSVSCAEALY